MLSHTDQSSLPFDLNEAHSFIRSILLIDAPGTTQPVGQFLRQKGWFVEEASNTGQARNLFERFKPDFVITELLLPMETGIEFCAWIKQLNSQVGTMIFSEVRLAEARNLAAWAGADSYLTKPTDPETLYLRILRAISRVRRRSRESDHSEAELIRFRCKCGKKISAKPKYAGRGIQCPACSHLVRVPESSMDSSSYFKSPFSATSEKPTLDAGVVCDSCGTSNLLSKCCTHGRYKCLKCQSELRVTAQLIEDLALFFGPETPLVESSVFNPLTSVYVRCEGCGKMHECFQTADSPQPCPNCKRENGLPDIRGVPLSRAALASTGRLFEVTLTSGKRTLFLLPTSRRWLFGSSADCAVSLRGEPLLPHHCVLKNTFEGPMLMPSVVGAPITLNQHKVRGPVVLSPGDRVMLGEVGLLLHGFADNQIQTALDMVMRDLRSKPIPLEEAVLSRGIATILQCHWQNHRLRLIEKRRNTVQQISAETSDSSVVRFVSESGLHPM